MTKAEQPTIKYRKTALIEATQWRQMGDHPAVRQYDDIDGTGNLVAWVDTLEGGHRVTPGDWIATGVNGEHWPIKPDIFAKTYEPVGNTRTTSLAAQDGLVEKMARNMVIASGKNPDTTTPAPRGSVGMRYLWQSYEHLAKAALSAIKGEDK